ncbi:MAG: hypothetical protein OJF47_001126 [Nitrospira sp.]|nr:MAG: hypothetical protein OJF47_001126 [Nitrospira sp.]
MIVDVCADRYQALTDERRETATRQAFILVHLRMDTCPSYLRA